MRRRATGRYRVRDGRGWGDRNGIFALVGAFVGSILRPFAEDRPLHSSERRARAAEIRQARVARLEEMRRLLDAAHHGPGSISGRQLAVREQLATAASMIGDESLTRSCELIWRRLGERQTQRCNARRHCGELIRELETSR
jgi:hypothetical protein